MCYFIGIGKNKLVKDLCSTIINTSQIGNLFVQIQIKVIFDISIDPEITNQGVWFKIKYCFLFYLS